jgi:hypothetical protein
MGLFKKKAPKVDAIRVRSKVSGRVFILTSKPMPAGPRTKADAHADRDLKEYRKSGVVSAFYTLACDDSCEYCKAAEQYLFPVQLDHPLPHAGCTSHYGCRCVLLSVSDVEEFDEI